MQTHWTRRTALFLIGQTITLFGSSVVQYTIGWHITLSTKSGAMLTIATLCGFLPQVLITLFAGVWADRYNRKLLIVLADGMIALCTAVLAILFSLGYTELWLLFVISAIRSVGAGIQTPAVSAFLPELVPQDKLMRVNGINASIMSLMLLLAPAAAGGLYAAMGLAPVFWVDVITAAIGISLLLVLKAPAREASPHVEQHFLSDMLGGIRYITRSAWLREMILFYLFTALMFGPVVFLTPLMVARSFGEEPWRLVVHEMVFAGGSILGGLVVGLWGGFKNKVHTLIAASAAFGLLTLIMGFSPSFWFYLGVMLPMGISMPFVNTTSMTVLQTRVQPEVMGRVFGLVSIIGSTAMPLSMLIFGPLADVMSVELQLIISGFVMVVISLIALRFRSLIQAGEPVLPEQAGTPAS